MIKKDTDPESITLVERGKPVDIELSGDEAGYLSNLRSFPSNRRIFSVVREAGCNEVYTVKAQGCAGVVQLSEKTLLIRPRLLGDRPHSNQSLLRFMEYAYKWPQLQMLDVAYLGQNLDLFDWLVRVFIREAGTILKRGVWKEFRSYREKGHFVRGKLNVPEQIVLTLQKPALFSCIPTHHSAAIPNNLLIQEALEFAAKYCSSATLRTKVKAISVEFQALTNVSNPTACFREVKLDRLNMYYEKGVKLAHLVLGRTGPVHTAGETQFFSFLIDMWALFERFIGKWLSNYFSGVAFQKTFSLDVFSGGSYIPATIKPDFVLYENGKARLVIDTKYVSFPGRNRYGKDAFHMSHIYQMATYCAHLQCNGVLLYPSDPNKAIDMQSISLPSVRTIHVKSIPWEKLLDPGNESSKELIEWLRKDSGKSRYKGSFRTISVHDNRGVAESETT